jgi:YD repeat-containing protein
VAGRGASLTDTNGNTLSFAYSAGKLSTVTDAFGRRLTFTYTGALLTSVLDSAGRSVGYGYDGAGNLIRYTDPENNAWTYGYGGPGQLTALTDPLSQTYITNTFDSQGKATIQVALRQNSGTATYKAFVNDYRSAEVDPFGNADVYFYDRQSRTVLKGRTLAGTSTVVNRSSMTYDGQDHVTQATEPNTYTTSFSYDGNNNLTQITDPFGKTTTHSYEGSLFRMTKTTDPLGHFIDFAYTDSAHPYRLTQTTTHPSTSLSAQRQTLRWTAGASTPRPGPFSGPRTQAAAAFRTPGAILTG